jgi:methyl-accepting chemotaxis protein
MSISCESLPKRMSEPITPTSLPARAPVPSGTALAWHKPALAAAMLLAAGLAWLGGVWGLAGVASLACAAWATGALTPRASPLQPATADTTAIAAPAAAHQTARNTPPPRQAAGGRQLAGQSIMINEVIPVWARQLDITRSTSDEGLAHVLNAFTEMSGSLDSLMANLHGINATSEPGAIEDAVAQSNPSLQTLASPALRACEQRNAAMAELNRCAEGLVQMTHFAQQINEIGRHTRLVAFNASIESSRAGSADAGNGAVATEMRLLAARMGDCGAAVQRLISEQRARLESALNSAVTQQTTPDELRLEIELRAREALQMLMASIGASLSTSSVVRDASTAMRDSLDQAFVHFQFGDRISQMLSIIGSDMNNFVEWTTHNPGATRDDAIDWLKRLEGSYTMDEQRSEHHGNAHVDRGSEVEFF